MQIVDDPTKTYPKKTWYEKTEIEEMMEAALKKAAWPRLDNGPAIHIEKVVERLGFELDSAELPVVPGTTVFHQEGKPTIFISNELYLAVEAKPSREVRLRSTVAHELAHALLHPVVFKDVPQGSMCRSVTELAPGQENEKKYKGEWWEYQANMGMAALLMPRELFFKYVVKVLDSVSGMEEFALPIIADRFNVSQEAVRYRAQELGLLKGKAA